MEGLYGFPIYPSLLVLQTWLIYRKTIHNYTQSMKTLALVRANGHVWFARREGRMTRAARDVAVFTLDDEAPPLVAVPAVPLDRLASALMRFRLHGRTSAAMVARLDGYLDRLAAIPVGDWCRWQDGAGRWLALRCGPLTRPPPPHLWPWRLPLAAWTTQGYPLACRCRAAFLRLDKAGQRVAQDRWGRLRGEEGGMDFGPLWRLGTPVEAIRALDDKAEQQRVRTMRGAGYEATYSDVA